MKKLVLVITFLAMPFTTYAQDAIYLSGMLGLTQVDVDSNLDYDAELSYGARAGLLFNDHVSAGLFLHRSAVEPSNPGLNSETTIDNVMAEVTYYFAEADENSFWISGLLGLSYAETKVAGDSVSDDATALGVSGGYHFMVAPNFSISPQVTFIRSSFDTTASELSGMVNLTFWL